MWPETVDLYLHLTFFYYRKADENGAEQRKDEIEQLIKQRLIRTIDLLIPEIVSIQEKYDSEESRSREEENKTREISMGNHSVCK